LWLILDVYEADLTWLSLGQRAEFQTQALPGETFTGAVSFIDPVLDERSRSVKVRVEVDNADLRLKPGMFARAVIRADVHDSGDGLPLVVPASAPLVTGTRAIVYVADSESPGRYHGREVVLGPAADGFYVVRQGLTEGELVVSHGAFKIDSALQILAKSSMMNPDGGGPVPGHEHGQVAAVPSPPVDKPGAEIDSVPHEFRVQLDDILALYFDLSTALSRDDLAAAATTAQRIPVAAQRTDRDLLPPSGQLAWDRVQEELTRSSAAIGEAADIASARDSFYDLSVSMISAVKQFRTSGRTPVLIFHCPMARDGNGANWLQAKEGTENPYFGHLMPTCGAKVETLSAGSESETELDHHHR
jgi:Cu(I)/Ag(I) efflux system membrane fusion protein